VNPFVGGDKQLDSLKAWMNAIMTSLLEIKGTPSWFSAGSSGPLPSLQSLRQDLGNTVITGSGSIAHGVNPVDKVTPTEPGQINWDQPVNLRVVGSALTYTLSANATSADILLTDDEVAYITLIRDIAITPNLIFVSGSNIVTSVGSVVWTTGLQAGDFIKVATDTDAGYYQILTLGTSGMSFTDSGYSVTLTTVVSVADGTGSSGTQAEYAFGTYNASPTPSTTRDIFIATRETVPNDANVFWLFMRTDNGGSPRVYIRFLGAELDNGEDREVDGTTSEELLKYIGAPSQTVFLPGYVSAYNVYEGNSPTVVKQITDITTDASSTMTSEEYFLIYSSVGTRKYYVWVKKDGSGTDPMPIADATPIEWDVSTGQTSTQTAASLVTALNSTFFKDFTANNIANAVTVTNSSAGATNAPSNVSVGGAFTISVATAGTGVGNFVIQDGDNLTLAIKKLDQEIESIATSLDAPSYDEVVEVVASGATPPTSILVPGSFPALISLPNNTREGDAVQYYTVGKGSLMVFLNGQFLDLEDGAYNEYGTAGSPSNQILMVFPLVIGDSLEIRLSGGGGGAGGGGGIGPAGPAGPSGPTGPAGADAAGGPVSISTKTGDYSILTTDCFLAADCTSGPITFTLPSASANTGRIFYCKKIDSSANFLTIAGSGGDTIDGASSQSFNGQWMSLSLVSTGSTWWRF
jgi:hypothetical protein